MTLSEMLKKTGLTRKAAEYYIEQGLVAPGVQENGYRVFSGEDVRRLKAVSVLRKLELSVCEIREILDGDGQKAIDDLLIRRALLAGRRREQDALLARLSDGASVEEIGEALCALDAQRSIAERLLDAFPGFFGQYCALHFAHFLSEPIRDEAQQQAYEEIVSWLDGTELLELPQDLAAVLDEATRELRAGQVQAMHDAVLAASENPEAYFRENKEAIRAYTAIRETQAFRESPAARLWQHMRAFQQKSGYCDVFLPAMKRLSPAYAAYCERMERSQGALKAILEE